MTPWPHQLRAVNEIEAAIARGERRICLTIPTGGGKTWVAQELIRRKLAEGKRAILYTNRRALVEQTSNVMADAGVYHGVRAAGYQDEREHPFQISSLQTEQSRTLKRKTWELHNADLVIVDEGHLHTGPTACEVRRQHSDAGAAIVDLTATPINMGDVCNLLIQAGTVSELRECGALVPAVHFGPDEPDMRAFKKLREGEDLSESEQRKAMMTPTLWGRVWEWFEKLNPDHRPTILFAPGVRESIWFAERFQESGVTAAHIDGTDVWIDGELHKTSTTLRNEVLDGSRTGRIKILCNRFVLREGIDAPWLAHGIFATVFGALQSYLQSGGRLLRSHPSLETVTIQDHGGNWWRHGSLNADRQWLLEYTATMVYGLRADRLRAKRQEEPFRCPQCGRIWNVRTRCQPAHGGCGYELKSNKRSRAVVSTDGSLKQMVGDIFVPRRISRDPHGPQLWERMYHRSRTERGARSFRAAAALFAYENDWGWPDPNWPLMPIHELDWYQQVADVPRERLT